ncbi:MAG: BamA/TamA family outer membrane protein [Cyanobacteria bacterium P01_A01_bin.135]
MRNRFHPLVLMSLTASVAIGLAPDVQAQPQPRPASRTAEQPNLAPRRLPPIAPPAAEPSVEFSPVEFRSGGARWLADLPPARLAQIVDEESDVEITPADDPESSPDPLELFDDPAPNPAVEVEIDIDDEDSVEEAVEDFEEDAEPDADAGEPADEETPATDAPEAETAQPEPRVQVAEVRVSGVEDRPELEDLVYQQIQTQPGRVTTRSQLQSDINAVFATGFFTNVQTIPEDTPLGVRVTFFVEPNPILREVDIADSALAAQGETLAFGGEELEIEQVADAIFSPQYGETLNLITFQQGIDELSSVYEENGYVLAQVLDARQISDNGVAVLEVAEGVIEDIEVKFLDEDGLDTDEDGEPIEGRTRDFIITREFETESGDVFNQEEIQQDLQQVFELGLFDDVRVTLEPGEDPRNVDVVVNVIEGRTGSLAAGLGFGSSSGLFGSVSYQQRNLGGNNQQLGAEVQIGEREFLFDVRFTDPWIAGDPYRTSYTVNAFSRRSISLIFNEGENDVDLPNGDTPRVQRLGGAISFSRPLDEWLGWEGWRASTQLQYQRVSIRDSDGALEPEDELGNDLSFDGDGTDDLFTLQLAAVRDRRNDSQQPTSGSLLRVGTEQSIPIGDGSIFFNRLRGSYSFYLPADITGFTDGPEAFAFNVQAGTVLGDLPPYEAFSLGGTDSVRGYDAGELAGGRSFVQATAEYRFPIFSIVGGALFADFGTDLGTGSDVPGEPAEVREKPGTGFGYGIGVRVRSPLGAIRVDYGINDDGDSRIHFGIGERF